MNILLQFRHECATLADTRTSLSLGEPRRFFEQPLKLMYRINSCELQERIADSSNFFGRFQICFTVSLRTDFNLYELVSIEY